MTREEPSLRRIRAMEVLFSHPAAASKRAREARRQRLGAFLAGAARASREARAEAREGAPDVLSILGVDGHDEAHAALLAWALDPEGEHGLGERFAREVSGRLGERFDFPSGRYRVQREGATVRLSTAGKTLALALTRRDGVPSGPGVRAFGYDDLERVLTALTPRARAASVGLLELWASAVRRTMLGRQTMTEWKGFSPDVTFLLEHWDDYQELRAVREQLDREFEGCRARVLERVRARYPADEGWDATLDEDWVLLRRASWPVPNEEWLGFVVVLTDVDAVTTEGSGGWWSALALPTDGDFDAETFSTLVRGRMDPAAWRAHLTARWPGYALGRHLPRIDGRAVLLGEIERLALDEFARYVQLVPLVDQALRDLR